MQNQELTFSDLEPHERDCLSLANLAGITVSPQILRIVLELLELNVHPILLTDVLRKTLRQKSAHSGASSRSNSRKSSQSDKSTKSTKHRLEIKQEKL